MKVKVLKPCIINGESHKPSKKEVEVSNKDGLILISLGKCEDLSPKKEPVSINLDIDMAGFEEVKKEIGALTARVEELTAESAGKDATIEELTVQIAALTAAPKDEVTK